jgi:ribosome biogenesis GTPase / thiamine phosphate phosphatase
MDDDLTSTQRPSPALERLGWTAFFQRQLEALGDADGEPVEPARVAAGGRGTLHVLTASGPRVAVVSGRLLHETRDQAELPAVGDWIGLRGGALEGPSAITHTFTRRTCLLRKAAGKRTEAQVLAANIDTVMIVSSLNAEFNPRRLERYVEAVLESGARPVLVLNKADLCDAPELFLNAVGGIAPTLPVVQVSALSGSGFDALRAHVREGETIALVGSSGVGKSTITNRLLLAAAQREGAIREDDDRGRHTTAHRELFPLPSGGLLMDTPGLRELQLWTSDEEGPAGFDDVLAAAAACRFRDCTHRGEPGCAVERAVQEGALDAARVGSFHKLMAERRHVIEKQDARARLEGKRRIKQLMRGMRQHPKR